MKYVSQIVFKPESLKTTTLRRILLSSLSDLCTSRKARCSACALVIVNWAARSGHAFHQRLRTTREDLTPSSIRDRTPQILERFCCLPNTAT